MCLRGGGAAEGRRITSVLIDYWSHYNESKQFGVILRQVAADTWQQRSDDQWITRRLAWGGLELCRGSNVMCGDRRWLTGCLPDYLEMTSTVKYTNRGSKKASIYFKTISFVNVLYCIMYMLFSGPYFIVSHILHLHFTATQAELLLLLH